jgi:integrase
MSPRPRQSASLPNGIKPEALPIYVYWDATGKGRWLLKTYDRATRKTSTKRLAGPKATLREIWDAYEAHTQEPPKALTVRSLIEMFEASPQWADLAETTRRDYRICAASICAAKTKNGQEAGETHPGGWTPGGVRKVIEARAETSRSRANHDLRYLRRLFSWAVERDLIATNPARGVSILKEASRDRYVTDDEYVGFLALAGEKYPYLAPVAELAYLCRLRVSEVCDLRRDGITEAGLFAARRKGSKDALTGWTPRLRAAVDCALGLHEGDTNPYLIPGATGGRMGESTIQTAWQRSMVEWAALGNPRWTIHDIKRKGISDFEGDKLAASGHRSASMLKVYDVLPSKAPATR